MKKNSIVIIFLLVANLVTSNASAQLKTFISKSGEEDIQTMCDSVYLNTKGNLSTTVYFTIDVPKDYWLQKLQSLNTTSKQLFDLIAQKITLKASDWKPPIAPMPNQTITYSKEHDNFQCRFYLLPVRDEKGKMRTNVIEAEYQLHNRSAPHQ